MKKQLVSEVVIWLLAGVVTLFAIGGVNLSFGLKAISAETFIAWGIFMLSAYLIRNIFAIKGTWKGQKDLNYRGWLSKVGRSLKEVRKNLTFAQKREFCKDATQKEKEAKLEYLLLNKKIDNYFYENALRNKKDIKEWLKKQNELSWRQKRTLRKIVIKGVKVKPHNVNELNTSVESNLVRVYDLKDHTAQAKRKDLLVWLITASVVFLGLSSIIISASQNIIVAIAQSVIMLLSLSWNAFNSYIKHIGYITNEKVQFLQRKDNFLVDACKFNGVSIDTEIDINELLKEEIEKSVVENEKSNTMAENKQKTNI
jgi:hypothetical protein